MRATVYVARSVHDRPLHTPYELLPYEKEIQVGAAATRGSLDVQGITDDVGENISVWNPQFCELTALYWIWKNAEEEIVGLEHYRRHFILPEGWLHRMLCGGADVILPVPLYVAPSLEGNFKERHDAAEWDCMMQCIREYDVQVYWKAKKFFQSNLYSPCNMLIVRREILEDLCGWMFPILFRTVERVGQKADSYQNRYPGFLSERLITFFFEWNHDKYQTVYADKNFIH